MGEGMEERRIKCPMCGNEDTHFSYDAYFWTGQGWWCNDCEAWIEEEEE
jgi:transposase-like protein